MYFFYQPYPALVGALFAAAGLAIMARLAAPQLKATLADLRSHFGGRAPLIVKAS
jgi:hypothetical protein